MSSSLKVTNPFTEEVEFELPYTTGKDLEQVVAQARAAFEEWRWTSLAKRQDLCRGFMEEFRKSGEEVASQITRQMGKPLQQAKSEVNGMLDRAAQMIDLAPEVLADEMLPEKQNFIRYIRHEPLGVVLDIAAWNYPLLIAVNVVVPAVLAGNAVIIKHSSKTPLCGEAFADAFRRAGAPQHLIQNVIATHGDTEKLIQHPGIDYVSFTGSVRGGHEVSASASSRFIDIGLELGGKDPAYVCADAPFDFAVANCVDGAFYNAGQSCCAVERIYVDRAIYDDFVEAFAKLTRDYVLGDPQDAGTNIGPMASSSAPKYMRQQVDEAVSNGGRLVVRPQEFNTPGRGWFAAPAVVADAPQSSLLMQEESFGPVIGILPVDSMEQAILYMNDSPYGLTASIWTTDQERAIHVGERIATGTFFMNRCDYLDPMLPWTGVKDTGRGVSLSKYGLLQLTRPKSMHLRVKVES